MPKQKTKQKRNIKKGIINAAILIIVVVIVIYAAYKVIELFIKPSKVVMVQQGTVTSEESTVRIYNKK